MNDNQNSQIKFMKSKPLIILLGEENSVQEELYKTLIKDRNKGLIDILLPKKIETKQQHYLMNTPQFTQFQTQIPFLFNSLTLFATKHQFSITQIILCLSDFYDIKNKIKEYFQFFQFVFGASKENITFILDISKYKEEEQKQYRSNKEYRIEFYEKSREYVIQGQCYQDFFIQQEWSNFQYNIQCLKFSNYIKTDQLQHLSNIWTQEINNAKYSEISDFLINLENGNDPQELNKELKQIINYSNDPFQQFLNLFQIIQELPQLMNCIKNIQRKKNKPNDQLNNYEVIYCPKCKYLQSEKYKKIFFLSPTFILMSESKQIISNQDLTCNTCNRYVNRYNFQEFIIEGILTRVVVNYLHQCIQVNLEQRQKIFLSEFHSDQNLSIMLVGCPGSGKTTLFNKLCETEEEIQQFGASATQNINSKICIGSDFQFTIHDSPSLGNKQLNLIHLLGFINTLKLQPINRIILTLKLEKTNVMKKQIQYILKKYQNSLISYITVVVTHWDHAKYDEQQPQKINTLQKEIKQMIDLFLINSVMFVSSQDSKNDISLQLNKVLNRNKMTLTLNIFQGIFQEKQLFEQIQQLLQTEKEQATRKMKIISSNINQFLLNSNFISNDEQSEQLEKLILQIKEFAKALLNEYERENMRLFNYLEQIEFQNIYEIYDSLKMEIRLEVNLLLDLVREKINIENHFFSRNIKSCPYCGEVWLMIGCQANTHCGSFQESADDALFYNIDKWEYDFSEKFITLSKNEQCSNIKSQYFKHPVHLAGCFRSFFWAKQPSLSHSKIMELFDPELLNYLKLELKNQSATQKID